MNNTDNTFQDIRLADGQIASLRLLAAKDSQLLGAFFATLSDKTKSLYGPHPFDDTTAAKLTAACDDLVSRRFVAVIDDGYPQARMIAYMILTRDIAESDQKRYGKRLLEASASFAPVVGDGWQEQHIGSQMAPQIMAWAKRNDLEQVILMGGVQARNVRAKRFYDKLGFCQIGEFWTRTRKGERLLNYDMALGLK